MAETPIDISIIIVNWNTKQLLLNCLASVHETVRNLGVEIFVVDNGSIDGSVEAVSRAYPEVMIIAHSSNRGFAAANNEALRLMRGRYAVLLNSDTILKEAALEEMVGFLELHPKAGMCGPQLLNADGSKQSSIGDFPLLSTEFMSKKLIRLLLPGVSGRTVKPGNAASPGPTWVDFIVGACMVVRKSAIDAVGMLDEDYFFLYEETDWCFRMRQAGWLVYHVPEVSIYHLGGQSMKELNLRSRAESWRSRYLYFRKSLRLSEAGWYGLLLLGFMQNLWQFLLYSALNAATLFSLKRLRRRWRMFAYLLAWHLRGRPVSMGIPR